MPSQNNGLTGQDERHGKGFTAREFCHAKAAAGSVEYWGDTKTQALSVFGRMKDSLAQLGLGFGDVVAMTVYLVGDPAKGGRMDFEGLMAAYSQFFGTAEQPNLPARSTVQVAGLVQPGMLVEIEVQLAKRSK